jgi:membrane protein
MAADGRKPGIRNRRIRSLGGLTLGEFASRTWRGSNEDDIWGAAAELAFFFMLALFPMLIFVTDLVGFLPNAQQAIVEALGQVMPGQSMGLVDEFMHDVVDNSSGSLLSVSAVGAIWAASSGVGALIDTLNKAYQKRILVAAGLALTLFAGKGAERLAVRLSLGRAFKTISGAAGYALGLLLLLLGIEIVYYFGPNVERSWRWMSPGAAFAVMAVLTSSWGLSLYLRVVPSYSATYGGLGAAIILMLWLYLLGLALLGGGEINSEIERAADRPSG